MEKTITMTLNDYEAMIGEIESLKDKCESLVSGGALVLRYPIPTSSFDTWCSTTDRYYISENATAISTFDKAKEFADKETIKYFNNLKLMNTYSLKLSKDARNLAILVREGGFWCRLKKINQMKNLAKEILELGSLMVTKS